MPDIEKEMLYIASFVLGLLLVVGSCVGGCSVRHAENQSLQVQREAVEQGYAEWHIDHYGNRSLKWKKQPKKK